MIIFLSIIELLIVLVVVITALQLFGPEFLVMGIVYIFFLMNLTDHSHVRSFVLSSSILFLTWIHLLAGVPQVLDCYIGFLGQPRHVEYEVCSMGKAVSRTAILSQGL